MAVPINVVEKRMVAGATVEEGRRVLARCRKFIRIISIASMRKGLQNSVSPDGTPLLPVLFRIRGGNKPLLDTGRLNASLSAQMTGDVLELSSNAPGAALHQNGGTIKPKKGKFLSLPLTKEALYAGSPRRMQGLFLITSKKGSKLLVGPQGKRGIRPHWILKTEVTIPARPFLGISDDTVDAIAKKLAEESADDAVRRLQSP